MTVLVTAAAPAALSREFPDVLAGVMLDGAAADLAGLLDPGFLSGAGWDPGSRVLSPPAEHRLLGRAVCRVSGCTATMRPELGGVCRWCCTRLAGQGLAIGQIASMTQLPPLPARPAGCAVPGCGFAPPSLRAALCMPHYQQHRRMPGLSVGQFAAGPRARPQPPSGPCLVAACFRMAGSGTRGYCASHYQRWRAAARAIPDLDPQRWQATEHEVSEAGRVSLRGLAPLTVIGVLLGAQEHTRQGAKITDVCLRGVCDTLRRQQAASIEACDPGRVRYVNAQRLLTAMIRHIRRAQADPAGEQAQDVWDLGVFGHRGNLSFTGLSQGWLREAAKRWAAGDLPRHRGAGVKNVQSKINALTRLSESLRSRDDDGLSPAALGRPDIEAFLSRLAYLESEGRISHYRRTVICRAAGEVLAGIRALGLTRPGQPAAGLPGDFTLGHGDIPAEPERGEPGRDLPPEIMTVLCASLDTLQPAEIKVATQIGIDTGRRPEDILGLPLDCLACDSSGAPVLVYDNAKAGRLGRRLPISQAAASVITGQQARVRARFPATPASELKLLPSPRRNPDGRRHISLYALDDRHREWVTSLGTLRSRDGSEFDPARVTPYAYRHTYAQRHADAGIPIDVLAGLLDHRNLNVTRGYYRVGEDRRRAAVDKVTALSFDRHGNRIWRDAAALLKSEHARYAVGEIAVPYGTCTEPSNVQAGGGSCPVRFRCAGCDHFRTDVSYLPDLTAYLDDLLRTRERLTAAIAGVDEWARADATPAEEEITRIRRLIGRVKNDVAQLTDAERTQIDQAIATTRKHRAVTLGMPAIRAAIPAPRTEALA